MKRLLLQKLCDLFSYLKLIRTAGAFRKNRILVLMFHGITGKETRNSIKNIYGYNIPVGIFEKQMRYLYEHCNVIRASDAILGKIQNNNRKNIVITFDDGYRNNFTNAFPILSRYQLPALISLPISFINQRVPLWNDALEFAVIRTTQKRARVKLEKTHHSFGLGHDAEKKAFILWLNDHASQLSLEARLEFIEHVFKVLEVKFETDVIIDDPDYEPLSPKEIKFMSHSGLIEFASVVHHNDFSIPG